MKRLLAFLALFIAQTAYADVTVPPDATSRCFDVFITDSSVATGAGLTGLAFNTASLTAYYHRDAGATSTAITLATMTLGTFTSSGFVVVDGTNLPGWYQFCPPNAAFASGANTVVFGLKGATNMAPMNLRVQIGFDETVVKARGATTGSVYTLQSATSTTAVLAAAESSADDRWKGSKLVILGGTAGGSFGCISAFTNSSDTATVNSWSGGTPDSTSTYSIVSDPACQLATGTITVTAVSSDVMATGTAQSGGVAGTNTFRLAAAESANADFKYSILVITGGAGVDQVRQIMTHTGATDSVTVDRPWKTTTDNTSTYAIIGFPLNKSQLAPLN